VCEVKEEVIMSKRRNDIENQIEDVVEAEKPMSSSNSVQNTPPNHGWLSFDSFWNSTVKNGTPLLKESFKYHHRAMGWL
jgi:hypothetical protein